MITIKKLNKKYGNEQVLKNINIQISGPGFAVLEGPSGCGKSTLLNILSLMDLDFEGEYFFNGINVKKLNAKQREEIITNQITYLFQEPKLIENESIKTNLELMCNKSLTSLKIDTYLKEFKLKVSLDQEVKNLSKGEKKRVYLIGAILRNTPLLILDEITSGLDEENASFMMDKIKKLSLEKMVILVTHDVTIVSNFTRNIYHFENKSLPLIRFNKGEFRKMGTPKVNKLPLKYLFFHLEKMVSQKRIRTLILLASMVVCLFTMGLSFLISDNMKGNLTSSLTSYFGTNQILMEPKNKNEGIAKNQVVDENEFEDFYFAYDDLIESYHPLYLANFENMFKDENYLSLNLNTTKFNLRGYGVSSLNEYVPLELTSERVYPTFSRPPAVNEIIITLNERDISSICSLLRIGGYDKSTLEKYLTNHVLEGSFHISNNEWEYFLEIPFKIVGFVVGENPLIYSYYQLFNEKIIEKTMQLPYSYFLNEIDYYPWTTKKLPCLIIKNENVEEFYRRMLLDKRMNRYLFHKASEEDFNYLFKDDNECSYIYFTYQDNSLSLNDVEELSFKEDNIDYYLPCGSSFYNVEETSLLSGFDLPLYFSNDIKVNDEFIDLNSFSESNLSSFQGSSFVSTNSNFFTMNLLDCSKPNFVKYVSYNENVLLKEGRMPLNSLEVIASSKLSKSLNLELGDKLFFSALTNVIKSNDRFQNIFETIEVEVVGIKEEDSLAIYQENNFPLILMNVYFNLNRDLKIDKFVLNLKDNNEDYLNYLNVTYKEFSFTNPLKIYLNSLEKGLNYLSLGLLIFSLITLISSFFMMILVNYLFLQENEREIAIYTFLGYRKKSILTLFLMLGIFFFLTSFVVTSISLIGTSFIIPLVEDNLSSFKLTYFPFLLILLVEVVSLGLVILLTYFSFRKKDVIEMIKK